MGGVWGLLGPEQLPISRRTRSLGLAATIRRFNELAVPGMGGVWYGKRFLLATLGIVVAERVRLRGGKVQNIEVANAVEALACCLAFKGQGWQPDARLRGRTKLQRQTADLSFGKVGRRGFYVSQPMRMAAVRALPALGFAENGATRFNAFRASDEGEAFVEDACRPYAPYNRSVVDHLVKWVRGEENRTDTASLSEALSPLLALPGSACTQIRARLELGGKSEEPDSRLRRRSALNWVASLDAHSTTDWRRPAEISDDSHWHDLQAGAAFFAVRDAAISTLDAVEGAMGPEGRPTAIDDAARRTENSIDALRRVANEFLALGHRDAEALDFSRLCAADSPAQVLRGLVERDGRVLRLAGSEVRSAGAAFRGTAVEESSQADEDDDGPTGDVRVPAGTSYRVRNLYLLNLDMQGRLGEWLQRNRSEAAHEQ